MVSKTHNNLVATESDVTDGGPDAPEENREEIDKSNKAAKPVEATTKKRANEKQVEAASKKLKK